MYAKTQKPWSVLLGWRRTNAIVLLVGLLTSCSGHLAETANPGDAKARLARAEAMFNERCKVAGEKIYRTAENVEGVFLMKIRRQQNSSDQFALDDQYGHDSADDEYIKSFLQGRNENGYLVAKEPFASAGYRFVEAIDLKDGKRYQYKLSFKEVTSTTSVLMGGDGKTDLKSNEIVLDKISASGAMARYGVIFDDISTQEDREYWIAGSSLRVIDLQTNEVIAERIGYMMDRGQGGSGGGRQPWLFAADYACPSFRRSENRSGNPGFSYQVGQTRNFVEKVLRIAPQK